MPLLKYLSHFVMTARLYSNFMLHPRTGICHPNAGSGIWDWSLRIQGSEFKTQDSESGTHYPGPRTHNQKPRTKNPELGPLICEHVLSFILHNNWKFLAKMTFVIWIHYKILLISILIFLNRKSVFT